MATTDQPQPTTKDIGPKNPVVQAGMGVVDYVDERTSVTTGAKWFMFRNIPRGTSWFQTLGFSAMVVFGMQAITGIVLAMYYQPDPATAHASIANITNDVTWGWLVRGMHKWGASAMIVIVFLHMGRVFIWGAYKYPRELTWVTGALLLFQYANQTVINSSAPVEKSFVKPAAPSPRQRSLGPAGSSEPIRSRTVESSAKNWAAKPKRS